MGQRLHVVFMMQSPTQRVGYRLILCSMVYASIAEGSRPASR